MSEAEKEVSVLLATTRENAENERINALRVSAWLSTCFGGLK